MIEAPPGGGKGSLSSNPIGVQLFSPVSMDLGIGFVSPTRSRILIEHISMVIGLLIGLLLRLLVHGELRCSEGEAIVSRDARTWQWNFGYKIFRVASKSASRPPPSRRRTSATRNWSVYQAKTKELILYGD
jgi:hypothetical protein